jgi:hypothetical protein
MWRNDQALSPEVVAYGVAICHSSRMVVVSGEASRAVFPCPAHAASSRSLQALDFPSSPATSRSFSAFEIPCGPLFQEPSREESHCSCLSRFGSPFIDTE